MRLHPCLTGGLPGRMVYMIFYRPVPEFSCGDLCHTGNSFPIWHVSGRRYHHTALTAPGIGREVGAFAGAQRGLGAMRRGRQLLWMRSREIRVVCQGYDSVTAGSSGGSDVNADLHHPGHCIAPAIDRDSIAPRYVSRDLCNHNFSAGCLSNSSISPGHEESNS